MEVSIVAGIVTLLVLFEDMAMAATRRSSVGVDPTDVVLGVELEAYTIQTPEFRISRQMAFPRKGVAEKRERFARDSSIGTEYNSQPFSTLREGLFLLKTGLRKYDRRNYRTRSRSKKGRGILLVGGWRDRFAGAHVHVSVAKRGFDLVQAKRFAWHIHDHIPLLIAMGANSPVWADEVTEVESNRVLGASDKYFRPIDRRALTHRNYDEMLLNRGRVRKPATVEVRVLDSNIPEYVLAAACVIKAVALRWLSGHRAACVVSKEAYLQSRRDAAARGMKSRLCWNGMWMSAAKYLDRFTWEHRQQLETMDIPDEVWTVLKLLKKRITGATILRGAVQKARDKSDRVWQRRFARKYVSAISSLLSGNDIYAFAEALGVELPDIDSVWLGRRNLNLE